MFSFTYNIFSFNTLRVHVIVPTQCFPTVFIPRRSKLSKIARHPRLRITRFVFSYWSCVLKVKNMELLTQCGLISLFKVITFRTSKGLKLNNATCCDYLTLLLRRRGRIRQKNQKKKTRSLCKKHANSVYRVRNERCSCRESGATGKLLRKRASSRQP